MTSSSTTYATGYHELLDMTDTDDDKNNPINRAIKLINKAHGYAGIFNHGTSEVEKSFIELYVVREWIKSIGAVYGLHVGEPEQNSNDPPDCYITFAEQRLGVELVQLIDSNHKKRASQTETPFHGQLFSDMQWSKARFISKLNDLIRSKGDNYHRREISIDVLLIHTAEPWLTSEQANEWLADCKIGEHPNIACVFLLFEYDPTTRLQHWPMFSLYGDILRNPSDF